MSGTTIKITIPDSSKNNTLLLEDLCEYLKNVKEMLQKIESSISGSAKHSTEYVIHDLEKNSPAVIEITIVPKRDQGNKDLSQKVSDGLWRFLESVHNKESLGNWDPSLLESCQSLVARSSKLSQPITFASVNGINREISLNQDSESYLKDWLDTEIITWGFVQGYLEGIDIHRNPKITIYPIAGAKKIKCFFKEEKLEIVKSAIGRYVEITGMVHYRKEQYFPYKVELQEIEVYPVREKTLPLSSFQGILENVTNGVGYVEYVRALRDDE
jgi:hypothetical protein